MAEPRLCSAPGCRKPVRKNKFAACAMHHARMERHGSFDTPKRPAHWPDLPKIGDVFGHLKVIGEAEPYLNPATGANVRMWAARCSCGQVVTRNTDQLRKRSRDCGCQRVFRAPPVGAKIGKLTVTGAAYKDGKYWRVPCRCECGDETRPFGFSLTGANASQSCGRCDRSCSEEARNAIAAQNTKHGWTGSPEYNAWLAMRKRCTDPRNKAYRNYGGRGIRVCDEWLNDFQAFIDHIGPKPDPSLSIDRIDNSRGYEPGNVRWADAATQNRNRRPFMIVSGSR